MFKKILFPIDCSLHSNTILGSIPYLKMVGMEEAILLHVIDPADAVQWESVEEAIAGRQKKAEEKMVEIISEVLSPHTGIRGRHITAVGLPWQVILETAEEEKASLIIMGSHGRSYMEGALLGSVTNSVIRKTKIPVIIAKILFVESDGERKPECMGMEKIFRKILYPTDFSEYSMSVLNVMENLETAGVEEVVITHIQDTRKLFPHLQHRLEEFNRIDSERLAKIRDRLEACGYKVTIFLKEGVPFVEINKIAEEEDVSLIMLSSQGKGAVKEALMGSVSESVARDHIRPVMIIPKNWEMGD